MNIGVDLDGVCYDFAAALRNYLVREGRDPASMPDPLTWHFYSEQWGMTLVEFKGACDRAARSFDLFISGPPHVGAVETLQRLADGGHKIHIVTDRFFGESPQVSHLATIEWLWRYDIPYHTLSFSPDKTIAPADIWIEDRAENYLALDAAGKNPYLFDRPWNQHLAAARRVTSWAEFEDTVAMHNAFLATVTA